MEHGGFSLPTPEPSQSWPLNHCRTTCAHAKMQTASIFHIRTVTALPFMHPAPMGPKTAGETITDSPESLSSDVAMLPQREWCSNPCRERTFCQKKTGIRPVLDNITRSEGEDEGWIMWMEFKRRKTSRKYISCCQSSPCGTTATGAEGVPSAATSWQKVEQGFDEDQPAFMCIQRGRQPWKNSSSISAVRRTVASGNSGQWLKLTTHTGLIYNTLARYMESHLFSNFWSEFLHWITEYCHYS